MTDEIIQVAANVYRRRGAAQPVIAVGTFGSASADPTLLPRLARLLDSGQLVAHERGVALAPSVRLALANRATVSHWLDDARSVPGPTVAPAVDTVRGELRTLCGWATGDGVPDELTQRAAELAGVLAMADLDVGAMAVVAASGGSPRRMLNQLLAIKEGSCESPRDLRTAISRFVSTIQFGQ